MYRRRVLSPDEEPIDDDFYVRRKGPSGHEPQNFTAFRQAERLYKKRLVDLSLAVDFSKADHRVFQVGTFECSNASSSSCRSLPIYGIYGHEGFLYIPGALSEDRQIELARECFQTYINPPNVSNLDAHYSFSAGFASFYDAYLDGRLSLTRKKDNTTAVVADVEAMIRKIRWVTLGYQYDWTTKSYDFERSPSRFPSDLATSAARIAEGAGFSLSPEAGIINYYQLGDTLTGHVDRSEHNMAVPLLSMSLGLSAVFLLGGADRDDPVSAVVVRSGDVSLLSGPARKYYHGVPRILDGTLPAHFADKVPLLKDARLNINIRQVL